MHSILLHITYFVLWEICLSTALNSNFPIKIILHGIYEIYKDNKEYVQQIYNIPTRNLNANYVDLVAKKGNSEWKICHKIN